MATQTADAAPTASSPASSADVLLADGSVAVVRRLVPLDAQAVGALHARATDDSLRLRFFSPSRRSAQRYVDHVMGSPETLALVVEHHGSVMALATAEPIDETTNEIAFLVDDTFHGHGLGTLLLEHLAAYARDRGVQRFVADVLPDNHRMLRVFVAAGYDLQRHVEGGVVTLTLDTLVTAAVQHAADDRECQAEARSLAPLLHPESVVVVGVRHDGTGVGAGIVRSIVAGGFSGRLALVHPRAASGVDPVPGVVAYGQARLVPDGVDLAVIALPAEQCLTALEDAAAAGAGAVVVVSSGFAESGATGRDLQRDLARRARVLGVRLVGPNCLGIMVNEPTRLDPILRTAIPRVGGLALASQSGGVGIALIERARVEGLGLSCFVSLGNKADVSGNDLLAAWYDDPEVTVGALYLESFGNARKFARLARRFSQRKPLLAVVGGRSSGGRRAGASHTAATASTTVGVEALFTQAGVIGCRDVDDLVDTARLLAEQPLAQGPRVALVSNAGGLGVLAADRADDLGLEVPELSIGLQRRLSDVTSAIAGTANPVDTGPEVSAAELQTLVEEVLASGEVDVVLVVLVPTSTSDGSDLVPALARARAEHRHVPVVLVPLGGIVTRSGTGSVRTPVDSATTFPGIRAALEAISRVTTYAAWRSVPHPQITTADVSAGALARRTAAGLASSLGSLGSLGSAGAGRVSADEAATLLGLYGIDPVGTIAEGPGDGTADGPVEGTSDRTLVQPTPGGVEIALGITRDPGLGPLVVVGAGGMAGEMQDDRVVLVPPVTEADAARAVRSLRSWPLLDGFRGGPRCDVAGLEHLVLGVGRLAVDVPAISELRLDPVLVGPLGCTVVAVTLRLDHERAAPLPEMRGLRPVD